MSEYHEPSTTLEHPVKRRRTAERIAERLARTVRAGQQPVGQLAPPPIDEPEYSEDDELASWYEAVPRFPVVRSGYDTAAVDEHVVMLERELSELDHELAELRARRAPQDEVAAEIEKIGEQTSSILLAAHDQARETARSAQEQADRCIADAAAQAISITEEAGRKKAELEAETRRLAGERARLLADMEALAGTLTTVAREAAGRFTSPVGTPAPVSAAGSGPSAHEGESAQEA